MENHGALQRRGCPCCTAPGAALSNLPLPRRLAWRQSPRCSWGMLPLDQHRRKGTDGGTRGHQEQELLRVRAGKERGVTAVPSSGLCPLTWLPAAPRLGDGWEGAAVQLSPTGSGEGEPPWEQPPGQHRPLRLQAMGARDQPVQGRVSPSRPQQPRGSPSPQAEAHTPQSALGTVRKGFIESQAGHLSPSWPQLSSWLPGRC